MNVVCRLKPQVPNLHFSLVNKKCGIQTQQGTTWSTPFHGLILVVRWRGEDVELLNAVMLHKIVYSSVWLSLDHIKCPQASFYAPRQLHFRLVIPKAPSPSPTFLSRRAGKQLPNKSEGKAMFLAHTLWLSPSSIKAGLDMFEEGKKGKAGPNVCERGKMCFWHEFRSHQLFFQLQSLERRELLLTTR